VQSFVYDSGRYNIEMMDFTDIPKSTLWLAGLLIMDIKIHQAKLKEDCEAIIGGAEVLSGLTPMQRLYLLSKQGKNYFRRV